VTDAECEALFRLFDEARAENARLQATGASAMERAERALRRGAPIEKQIPSCSCFSADEHGHIRARDCHGVCKDAQEHVARAIEAAVREVSAAAFEEAAQVAERYANHPASGDRNNTTEAFAAGMNHRAGAIDNALCICDAIRALVKPQENPYDPT